MSLATAAKFYNVSPKSNESSGHSGRNTIENIRKKYTEAGNSSQISASNTSRVTEPNIDAVSFRPNAMIPAQNPSTSDNLMSFGGQMQLSVVNIKDSVVDSTIVKTYDDTRDDTKNHDDEFMYTSKYTDDE